MGCAASVPEPSLKATIVQHQGNDKSVSLGNQPEKGQPQVRLPPRIDVETTDLDELIKEVNNASSPCIFDLGEKVLTSGSTKVDVLQITANDVTIQGGTLELIGTQHFELDGKHLELKNIKIIASSEWGSSAIVTGERISLSRQASLLRGEAENVPRIGVLTCNMGSIVLLNGLTVEGPLKGDALVVAQKGAQLEMVDCTLSNHHAGPGVWLLGEGTHLKASRLTVKECCTANINIQDAAKATLSDCTISSPFSGHGIIVCGTGCHLTAERVKIKDVGRYGLYVTWGATATITDVRCNGSKGGDGLQVRHQGSKVVAKGSRFNKNKNAGVFVDAQSRLEATNCTFAGNAAYSAYVRQRGSVLIANGCNFESPPVAEFDGTIEQVD